MPLHPKKTNKPSVAVVSVLQQQAQAKAKQALPGKIAEAKPTPAAPAFNFGDVRMHPEAAGARDAATPSGAEAFTTGNRQRFEQPAGDVDRLAATELAHTVQQTPQPAAASLEMLPELLDEKATAPVTEAAAPISAGADKPRVADLAAETIAPVLKRPFNPQAPKPQRDADIAALRNKAK